MSRDFGGIVAAGVVGVVVWAFGKARETQPATQTAQVQPVTMVVQPGASPRQQRAALLGGLIDVAGSLLSGDQAGAGQRARSVLGGIATAQGGPVGAGGNWSFRALLDLIGRAEASGDYNKIWGGIRRADYPPQPLTQMTVDQVLAWQDSIDRKYNSEAAGRYQFMEDTLRSLRSQGAVQGGETFSPAVQDRLAIHLMRRRGLDDYQAGRITASDFADKLAREWAGLPVTRTQRGHRRQVSRGQSYYAGDGLNRSLVTPEAVLAAIGGIA